MISVIVPIYGVEAYLDKCVQSVASQTYTDLEIILVDDGSPDGCPAMCDAWAKKDRRITVVHKPNGGLSDARNSGLNVAKGDYISFVDSDDWIAPTMLESMLSALVQADADICSCGIINAYEDGSTQSWNLPSLNGNPEIFLRALYSNTAVPVAIWNKLYKRELWTELRFPNGKICEDAFTTYKLIDSSKKLVQIPDELYYYRIRSGSIMTSSFRLARMDEEEAWRCNYEFIAERYPTLKKAAFDFYLQKVNITIHAIGAGQRSEFQKEYDYLKRILKISLFYVLFHSNLPWKYRIKFILDFVQL